MNQIRSLSASRLGSKFQAVSATGTGPEAEKVEKKKETKKESAEEIYKVAFDYAADNADELTLTTGDLIKVRDCYLFPDANRIDAALFIFSKNNANRIDTSITGFRIRFRFLKKKAPMKGGGKAKT